ncbi:ABC transporter permease [Leifsonia sp. NPDC056665]|uniref:ABC transporter permease n=1 Tax=Leifsonia sp. NPDC056665 TaxID=3345901 RepID=UPI00368E99D4
MKRIQLASFDWRGTGLRIVGVLIALALAAGIGAVILAVTGQSPVDAYSGILQGSFGTANDFQATLALTTPLILSGLAFVVAFRSGVFNAGTQGQLVMGAFGASVAGSAPELASLPPIIHFVVILLVAMVFGAAWSLPPILMKIAWGTSEILTSLMLTYVAALLNDYLVQGPFRAKHLQPGANSQTEPFSASAHFPVLIPGTQVTVMLIIGIVLAVGIWLFFRRTTLGFKMVFFGKSPDAVRAAGISSKRVLITAMLGSGAVAGLAGAAIAGGVFQADITPFPADVGFNGVLAALLVNGSPMLVPFSSLLFGALAQGGLGLQVFGGISQYIASVLTATIILFAAPKSVPEGLKRLSRRLFARRSTEQTEMEAKSL